MLRKGGRILFADNSAGDRERGGIFRLVAGELGLAPYFYVGATFAIRESNLDREMRDDALPLYAWESQRMEALTRITERFQN